MYSSGDDVSNYFFFDVFFHEVLGIADWQGDGSYERVSKDGQRSENKSDVCEDILLLKEKEELQRFLDDKLGERDSIMEVNIEQIISRAVKINSECPQVS